MKELQVFSFKGQDVRTVLRNGEPWWILRDVCAALGIEFETRVWQRIREADKMIIKDEASASGADSSLSIINEPALYEVIIRSDKPNAVAFRDFVTHEILPSIRKHGMYASDELLDNPDLLLAVVQKLKTERDQRLVAEEQRRIAEGQRDALQVRLDEAEEWYFVKRWANENATNWKYVGDPTGRGQGWRKLKALSHALGLEVQSCFDANFGKVNAYHKSVFALL